MAESPQSPPPPQPDPAPGGQSRPAISGVPSAPPPPPPGYAPAPYAAPKGGGILQRLAVTLVASVLLGSLILNVYFIIIFSSSIKTGIYEETYTEGSADHRVVIVGIGGTIDDAMAWSMHEAFKYLDQKPPDAIVLRIESGGGGVTASDQIWHTIEQFKAKHPGLPIVASFGTVAASGGYYVAAPADYIFCEQTGITGSIGVMAQAPTLQNLMVDKLGVKWETMVATGSPDKDTANNIYRDWTDADRAVFEKLLDSAYDRFVEVVAQGRAGHLTEAQVRSLATGDIYTADEAQSNKLIDEVGYMDAAIAKAADLAGVPTGTDPTVNFLARPKPLLETLLGAQTQASTPLDLAGPIVQGGPLGMEPDQVRTWLAEFSSVRFEYRLPW